MLTRKLDRDGPIIKNFKSLNFIERHTIREKSNGELISPWSIDVYNLENTDILFVNFKSLSGYMGFPENIEEATNIIKNYIKF